MRIGIEHAIVYNKLKCIKVNKMGIQTLTQNQYFTLLKTWVMIPQKQFILEENMMKCASS